MTNYLGIDFGLAHIGLAVAESILATPLPGLKNDSKLFNKLKTITQNLNITHIIVGLPSGPIESLTRTFVETLKSQLNLPVSLHDETLSSHDAKEKLLEAGSSRKKRHNDHSYAAVLILEDYLESVLN